MTDRTVKVSLLLQAQGYMQGMDQAAKKTNELGTAAEKLAQQRQAFETLGRAAIGVGAGVALGVGLAVKRWADFDQQMSYVQAATHETAANMQLLEDAALEAGSRTVYSATEAAAAIEELARAGVSTQDILSGGLDAALDLAAAGGLEVADAAGIAATALKTFNLQGEDMSHVADLLAAGAGKAMGDVSQLSQALAQGGQVAKQTGLSIEETTAGLSAFAAQGLLGSDAGTSFRSMLQRLTPQSNEAKAKLQELGISAYDASGNFVGLAEFAGRLEAGMRDLTPEARNAAMATIFGSDAVRAASVLYEEGEAGIRDWIDAVNDQGYAAETAAMRLDNLKGDWEALTGATDTAMISMGEAANGPLRELVQGLTGLVDGFNDLPQGAKDTVMWMGLIGAGVALTGGAFLLGVPKVAAFKVGLQQMNITAATTRASLGRITSFLGGPWGIAMVAAAAVMTTFNARIEEGVPRQAELVNAIRTSTTAAEGFQKAFSRGGFEQFWMGDYADQLKDLPALLDRATEAGWRWGELTFNEQGALDSIKRYGEGLAEIASTDMPAAQQAFQDLTQAYGLNGEQTRQLLAEMPALEDAFIQLATDQGIATDSTEFMQLALGELSPALTDATGVTQEAAAAAEEASANFDVMSEALHGVADTALTLGEAQDAALGAINAMSEAAKEQSASLTGTDSASIALRDSIREVETAHRASAEAIIENGGTLAEAEAEWNKGRDAVLDMLRAKGLDTDQAAIWADAQLGSASDVTSALGDVYQAWLDLPENRETKYRVEAEMAMQKLQALKDRLSSIPEYKRITLESFSYGSHFTNVSPNATGNMWDKGKKVTAFATGGIASGIYPYVAGGIHKFAEAGPEAYMSLNPAFRNQNLDIWAEVGRHLGAWQPAPPSLAVQRPSTGGGGNHFTFGDIYGLDEAHVAAQVDKKFRRAMAVSGMREGVGD